jgi:hypothetical protein
MMITLKSNRLRVEIAEPGEAPNTTCRFDRAGFITDITLDGSTWFCASEPKNLIHPSSGGRGLCNEYQCDVSREAQIGEYFPKFGVGLIQKEADEKYIFYKKYTSLKPFPIDIKTASDCVVFNTRPETCLGYALSCNKTIKIHDNCLQIDTEVNNTGEKDIEISEYCHNFLSIAGMAIGPDYRLEFPTLKQKSAGKEALIGRNGGILPVIGDGKNFTFSEFNAKASLFPVDMGAAPVSPFSWRLTNSAAKAFVEETDDFKPAGVSVWAIDHIVSPEVFNHFIVKSGESKKWARQWKFNII